MFFHHGNDGRCSVVNGFSGAATPLPELAELLRSHMVNPCDEKKFESKRSENMRIKKVAMSSVAASPNHQRLVAVLASNCSKSRVFISTCRPAGEINSCIVTQETSTILDVAFFQGKMYAQVKIFQELLAVELSDGWLDKPEINSCIVTQETSTILDVAFFQGKMYAQVKIFQELLAVELSDGWLDKPPTPPGVQPQVKAFTSWIWPPDLQPDMYLKQFSHDNSPNEQVQQYLVESNSKLLLVRRYFRAPPPQIGRKQHLSCRFEVLEADLTDGPGLGLWKKARSLDGWALFVGATCSKSFRASDVDGARGDCVYFLLDHGNPLGHAGVYSVVHRTIVPFMPPSRRVKPKRWSWDNLRFPAWFFPVEV
uniref:KIB1-4 beta-propeller domain-containing protein n=1 Tax=Aegilops tauschii TaxID=37682 RepID=R7W8A3_AEGTA